MDYTKGKWRVYPTNHLGADAKIATGEAEQGIAYLTKDLMTEWVHNGTLITAAPENYETNSETLRIFRDLRDNHEALWNHLIEGYPDIANHWNKIKKALAKAEGKEEK